MMSLTFILSNHLKVTEKVPPRKSFSTFPKKIGGWIGKEKRYDGKIYNFLGVDDSILSTYSDISDFSVEVYIGFYNSQSEGDLIHSPKNCLPGSGWNIIEASIEELKFNRNNANKVKIVKLIIQKEANKQVVLYWFHSRGRVIYSEYLQKIYLVIDSVVKNRTDGSLVRIIAPITNEDEKHTMEKLSEFAKLLFPILDEYISP